MKKIFLSTLLSLSLISASFCPQISTGINLQNATAEDYETTTTTVETSDVMFQITTTAGTYTSAPFIPSGTFHDFIENSTTATSYETTTTHDFIENSTTATSYGITTGTTTKAKEKQPLKMVGSPDENGYTHVEVGHTKRFRVYGYYDEPYDDFSSRYDWGDLCDFTVEFSDPSVACIDYSQSRECNIEIKGLSPGETVLTVTTSDGRSASANIMVEEEKLKLLPDSGYYYDDTCVIPIDQTLKLHVYGSTNPDPEKYCNGETWLTFENSDPSIAEISYINTDAVPDRNILEINMLSAGETVFTAYSPDGRVAVLKLIVRESVVISTAENVAVNGTTAVFSTFSISTSDITTTVDDVTTNFDDDTTTTSVSVDTTTTVTEMTSYNPDNELPQTGNMNIWNRVVVEIASAMTITGTAMIIHSKKKDSE